MRDSMFRTSLRIDRWGRAGSGVSRRGNRLFVVPGGIPGERVTAQCRELPDGVLLCRIDTILEASPHRVDSGCPFWPDCSGCQWRHLAYPFQLDQIRSRFLFAFRKEFPELPLPEISMIPHPAPRAYRMRARVHLDGSTEAVVSGIRSRFDEGKLIPLKACPNHAPALNTLIERIETLIRRMHPDNRAVLARNVEYLEIVLSAEARPQVRYIPLSGRRQLDLRELPGADSPDPGFSLAFPSWNGSRLSWHRPVVSGGTPEIFIRVRQFRFRALPGAWTPVSRFSADVLAGVLEETLEPFSPTSVLEVGCGIGINSLFLARKGIAVHGLDVSHPAVVSARLNAAMIPASGSVRFQTGRADGLLKKKSAREPPPDVIILHGMRTPFGEHLFELPVFSRARAVILVSPGLFAFLRDMRWLFKTGWGLHRVSLFDQIPHTTAATGMAVFVRLPGCLHG